MARGREFDEKQALAAAAAVFWRKGYEATSVQDLVDATGVNRASLYGAFGDKQRLFQRALSAAEQSGLEGLAALTREHSSGLAQIRAVFASVAQQTLMDCRGCIVTNTAAELSAREPWMAEAGKTAREHVERLLRVCLDRAAAAGEIPREKASLAVARFLSNAILGLRVMAKMKPTRKAVEDVVRVSLSVLR